MRVEQIYQLVNSITEEVIGKSEIIEKDLSNVVDIGKEIFSATSVDNYVKSLVNHIGKVIFVNRIYAGSAPSILMDSWEFGSVVEKISVGLFDAEENPAWDLVDKRSYDPNVFYQPKVTAKFFNSKDTFSINVSITERQVKESFSSADQLNSFISTIYNSVENSITIKVDGLIRSTINNMTAQTLNNEASSGTYTGRTGNKAVNLLKLYNDATGNSLEVGKALTTPEFIRFASMTMANYMDRLRTPSTLFNVGSTVKFTPNDRLHVVMLSEFKNAANAYLQSDTFHNEYTALPNAETVAYWQGSGTDYTFSSTSKISVTIKTGEGVGATKTISCEGILGVMFDRDALGVTNLERRVTSQYNPVGEFYTNFYKFEAGYFNDLNENFVVFYIA